MTKKRSKSATVGEIERALNGIAPHRLAQGWDNVGLLVGDRAGRCRSAMLCIDLAPAVLAEAVAARCGFVFAYHPPLFKPVSRLLVDSAGTESLVHRAIEAKIAIYSSHTALDAAVGGTNDVLAGLCGLTDLSPFEFVTGESNQCKIVTFVPVGQLERVAQAMFAAGAGRIGNYEQCSYRLAGEGTFFGRESTNPRVGRRGRLEKVAEVRLEMVAEREQLPEVVSALRRNHPYEEPAFDVYPLAGEPTRGIGRVGRFAKPTTLRGLFDRLVRATGSKVATFVGSPRAKLRTGAVCAGAAGRLPFEKQRSANADVIVTGEIRHHDALAILRAGKTAIAVGHWESERPVLRPLAKRLAERVPELRVLISKRDAPVFQR